ncbi:hypothetical protein [Streptomyces mirabilis]|jgi:hypothetical protein|uniref:Uncharacterized protein n=1 Tax=Streptomyces mirabilis TaxID=68239 RepID=A0A1I2K3G3_9ACTN|nr:hypothetical protein [Streptomyces mirabilis]SFF60878.1 hypothetical protein SAMN02787118_109239 [Streptomyces mirabilis]
MPYATPAPLLEVDLNPGRPPILHTDTPAVRLTERTRHRRSHRRRRRVEG